MIVDSVTFSGSCVTAVSFAGNVVFPTTSDDVTCAVWIIDTKIHPVSRMFTQNLLKGKLVKVVNEILPDQIPRWKILHCPPDRPLTPNSLSQPHLNSLPHSPLHRRSLERALAGAAPAPQLHETAQPTNGPEKSTHNAWLQKEFEIFIP